MSGSPHDSPDALVDACYDLITFEAGGEPDWDAFRALFHRQAVLALRVFPEDDAITVMDLDAYMVKQMREGMQQEGYSETLVSRTQLVFHDVAEVRVVFEMRFGEGEPHTAIDVYGLVRLEGRWLIASIISDVAAPGEALPGDIAARPEQRRG